MQFSGRVRSTVPSSCILYTTYHHAKEYHSPHVAFQETQRKQESETKLPEDRVRRLIQGTDRAPTHSGFGSRVQLNFHSFFPHVLLMLFPLVYGSLRGIDYVQVSVKKPNRGESGASMAR